MSKFTISNAKLSDLTELTALFDAYRQFYGYDSDIKAAKSYLTARIKEQNIISFIARKDKHAIGFANIYPSFSSVSMQKLWILNDLYIDESARKQGTANALIEHIEDQAKTHNIARITLRTGHDNIPAQKCYEARDWNNFDCLFYSHDITKDTL